MDGRRPRMLMMITTSNVVLSCSVVIEVVMTFRMFG
jgi:hypothetical protein